MRYTFSRNKSAVIVTYADENGSTTGSMAIPVGKVIATSDKSAIITLKLLSTRKNILAFRYEDVENPLCSSPEDAVDKLNTLLNEN